MPHNVIVIIIENSGVCNKERSATILLGSNLGQVVYSHCLRSLLSSKTLAGTKVSFRTGLNGLTD